MEEKSIEGHTIRVKREHVIKLYAGTLVALVEMKCPPGADKTVFPSELALDLPKWVRLGRDTVLALHYPGRPHLCVRCKDGVRREHSTADCPRRRVQTKQEGTVFEAERPEKRKLDHDMAETTYKTRRLNLDAETSDDVDIGTVAEKTIDGGILRIKKESTS